MDGNGREKNEFEWEREFRRMDERVAACMAEIPSVLDLPGEDDLLRKRIAKKKPEFAVDRWDSKRLDDDNADFGEQDFPGDWKELDGADIYMLAENLAGNWARGIAVALPASARPVALRILCRHGKIVGYAVDLIDAARDDDPHIKVAICKRLAAEAEATLEDLSDKNIPKRVVERHCAALRELREKALDMLFKQRSGAS